MRFVKDVVDAIWSVFMWTWRTLRGVSKTLMPTLPRFVHELVAVALLFMAVLLVVEYLHDYAKGS